MAILFRVADETKMAILVRNDLKLSKGKTAAQAAHAAVSCTLAARKKDPKMLDRWVSEGQRKIVLKVNDERELFEFKAMAEAAGLVCCIITDAGRTEIAPGTVTCMGIGPGLESVIDKITGELKML